MTTFDPRIIMANRVTIKRLLKLVATGDIDPEHVDSLFQALFEWNSQDLMKATSTSPDFIKAMSLEIAQTTRVIDVVANYIENNATRD